MEPCRLVEVPAGLYAEHTTLWLYVGTTRLRIRGICNQAARPHEVLSLHPGNSMMSPGLLRILYALAAATYSIHATRCTKPR